MPIEIQYRGSIIGNNASEKYSDCSTEAEAEPDYFRSVRRTDSVADTGNSLCDRDRRDVPRFGRYGVRFIPDGL